MAQKKSGIRLIIKRYKLKYLYSNTEYLGKDSRFTEKMLLIAFIGNSPTLQLLVSTRHLFEINIPKR